MKEDENKSTALPFLLLILFSIFVIMFFMLKSNDNDNKNPWDGMTPEEYREVLDETIKRQNDEYWRRKSRE